MMTSRVLSCNPSWLLCSPDVLVRRIIAKCIPPRRTLARVLPGRFSCPVPCVRELRSAGSRGASEVGVSKKAECGVEEMATKRGSKTKKISSSQLTKCYLQVFGTGAGELSPSLYLFADSQRYLFNCGEGLQRFSIEHGIKMSRVKNIFVTRVSWRNLGGFTGLVMHAKMILASLEAPLQGARNPMSVDLKLHGPSNLSEFARSTRYFVGRDNVKLFTQEDCDASSDSLQVYKDENITVTTVELQCEKSCFEHLSSNSESESEPEPKKAKRSSPSAPQPANSIAVFVCKLADVPGKFNVQRATELGLKPGPMYRDLVQGKSVTTPEGRVVRPEDVIGPVRIGPSFIVVECPNIDFIPLLTSHPALQNDTFKRKNEPLALVVHITPPDVLQNDDYSRWISSFGPETKHLFLGKGVCRNEVGYRSVLKLQTPLHLMNPSIHCLPAALAMEEKKDQPNPALSNLPRDSFIVGETLLKYQLKPFEKSGVDRSDLDALGSLRGRIEDELKEIQENPKLANAILHPEDVKIATPSAAQDLETGGREEVEELVDLYQKEKPSSLEPADCPQISLSSLKTRLYQPPAKAPLRPDDAVVTFLGTGASCPSRYRNVSGILIQVPKSGSWLFDCGESTLSLIYRTFGQDGGDAVVRDLRAIFISHVHGDHQLGTVSILQRRAQLLAQERAGSPGRRRLRTTVVVGPTGYGRWLRDYSRACERAPHYYITNKLLEGDDQGQVGSTIAALRNELADFAVRTVPVVHCKDAYGVVLEHKAGWKIVYSGDTRPCAALVEAGRDATLLIHEATFEDDLRADAEAKKHCTITEALEVARQMNPNFVILTHFSQRYPMVSQTLLNSYELKGKVGVAFDSMSVRLSEVHSLPKFLPAMREIFAELVDVEEPSQPVVSWSWL